jgi:glutathione peroxidase
MMNAKDFTVRKPDGSDMKLSEIDGPILAVNVASKCGFTPQYEGLEALAREYGPKGLTVLGFPCNQFGAQEPGDAAEIANFCSLTYDVTFPVLAKVEVNGDGADPFYKFVKKEKPGLLGSQAIKWNFTKFLIDKDGKVVERFAPTDKPASLKPAIEKLLG